MRPGAWGCASFRSQTSHPSFPRSGFNSSRSGSYSIAIGFTPSQADSRDKSGFPVHHIKTKRLLLGGILPSASFHLQHFRPKLAFHLRSAFGLLVSAREILKSHSRQREDLIGISGLFCHSWHFLWSASYCASRRLRPLSETHRFASEHFWASQFIRV